MTRNHHGVVGENQELLADGLDDLRKRATPQVGAPDASGEERVAREHPRCTFVEHKTDAAR
jgi:hypothetical protein